MQKRRWYQRGKCETFNMTNARQMRAFNNRCSTIVIMIDNSNKRQQKCTLKDIIQLSPYFFGYWGDAKIAYKEKHTGNIQ